MDADLSNLMTYGIAAVLIGMVTLALLVRGDLLPPGSMEGGGRVFLGAALGIGVIAFAVKLIIIAVISTFPKEPDTLEKLAEIALANREVQARIENIPDRANAKFINYVLPVEWHVSEIPMNEVQGGGGHHFPADYDKNLYKIVFTKAELRTNQDVAGKDLLLNTVKRTPIVEVWLDLSQGKVFDIKNPPPTIKYENVPVPIY